MSPNHVNLLFCSYHFLRWLSVLEMWFLQLSVGVKASLVESQQMSSFPFLLSCCFHVPFIPISCCIMLYSFPFMFLSFCIMFLSFCIIYLSYSFHFLFMFLSCSFHFPFMSFHFPSLCIKHTSLWKVICSSRSGGYPPNRSRFHHISLSFLLSCCYRFGGLCRLPSSGFMNMYMYKFVIVFWAVNALVVLRGKPS